MSQGPAGEDYNDDSYWDDGYTPFRYEHNMAAAEQERRELANLEVNKAIEAYYKQKWYQTLAARIRFSLYWFTYVIRLRLALFIINTFRPNDIQFTQKVFYKLGI